MEIAPKRPKTGGRVRGTPNRKTRLKQQQIVDRLISETLAPDQVELLEPLEIMLRVMRARYLAGDEIGALQAAAYAAPYRHARLSSSDVTVRNVTDGKSEADLLAEADRYQQLLLEAEQAKRLN